MDSARVMPPARSMRSPVIRQRKRAINEYTSGLHIQCLAFMKTLYLDIFSGISGDMFIGALIDLGVDAHQLEHELEKLPLEGYHLHAARGTKASIEGVKFDVHLAHEHAHEHTH